MFPLEDWAMFFWPWHGLFFWPFFGHGVLTLIVLIILLWVIFHRRGPYYGSYGWHHPLDPPPPGNPAARSAALDILEQRYARGEIQREEYLQKKNDLLSGRAV